MAALTAGTAHAISPGGTVLTNVAQIRQLGRSESSNGQLVALHGLIIFRSDPTELFLLDGTGGVFVENLIHAQAEPGDEVEISGLLNDGGFAPAVQLKSLRRLGSTNLPAARPAVPDRLLAGLEDSEWIRLHGVVADVRKPEAQMALHVLGDYCEFELYLPRGLDLPDPEDWIGREIEASGACGTEFNARGQLLGINLAVPTLQHIERRGAALPAADATPYCPIPELLRYSPNARPHQRVRVRGFVTHSRSNGVFRIQTGTNGVEVFGRRPESHDIGAWVEVTGFPTPGENIPVLTFADVTRKDGNPDLPRPVPIRLKRRELNELVDGVLVQFSSRVVDVRDRADTRILILESVGRRFLDAQLPLRGRMDSTPGLEPGCRVLLTGVYEQTGSETNAPTSGRIWLNGPWDLQLVDRGPLLNPQRSLILAMVLVSTLLLIGTWAVTLRRALARQERAIAARTERENALQRRYRDLTENATDVIFTLDLAGHLKSFNPAMSRLTALPADRLTSLSLAELVIPEHRPRLQKLLEQAAGGSRELEQVELAIDTGDHHRVLLEVNPRVSEGENQPLEIEGVGRDITARRRIEDDLQESQERFRDLFQQSPDAVFVLAMDGRVLDANPAACQFHAIPKTTLINGSLMDLLPPALQEVAGQELEELSRSDGAKIESFRQAAGGRMVPVETRVSRIRFRGEPSLLLHVRDITEWTDTLAALRASEDQYRQVIDGLAEGVMVIRADGSVDAANESACRILNLPLAVLLKSNLIRGDWAAVGEEGRSLPPAEYPVVQTLRTGRPQNRFVMGLPRMGGKSIWLSINSRPLRLAPNGVVLAAVASFQEITEERRIRDELVRAKESAEKANRAKSDFLAHMSHEIRTPMSGVIGMHDVLLNTPLTAEQESFVRAASEAAEDLLQIINDLLDLSKIEAGKLALSPEDLSLRSLLESTLRLFATRADKTGVKLHAQVFEGVPDQIRADGHRLRQILSNLLSNAMKFTPSGSIWVEVRPNPDHGSKDHLLWFTVSDTGIGIPRDKLELIFDAFTQADLSISRRYGGTGLGLSICRQLVGLMGGRIWVESEPGHGSRFHFLARIEPARAPTSPPSSTDPPDSGLLTLKVSASPPSTPPMPSMRPAGRVLVVEDHPVNRQITESLVSKLGCETLLAANGREALSLLEREPVDLILMDIQMPELDGLAATRQWREREQQLGRTRIPIVAVTAHALPQDRKACQDAGMDDYLTKPLRREALQMALAKYLQTTKHPPEPSPAASPPPPPPSAGPVGRDQSGLNDTLLELLRVTSLEAIQRVRLALTQQDAEAAAREVHFLKGGCALLHDAALTHRLQELNLLAKLARLEELAAALPAMERQIEETVASHRQTARLAVPISPPPR